jgi:IS5 family transposase
MSDIRVKGRKRHLLVDTLGIPMSYYVTPADMHDTQGARRLLSGLKYFVPRLKKIWADQAYRGQELAISQPADEQGLRTQSANERNAHPGGDDSTPVGSPGTVDVMMCPTRR